MTKPICGTWSGLDRCIRPRGHEGEHVCQCDRRWPPDHAAAAGGATREENPDE